MTFEPTLTLSGIASIVAIIGFGYAVIMGQRKARRENESDGRARTDELKAEFRSAQTSISERVTALETRSAQHEKDFMPRPEILGAIDHLKTNRVQAETQITRTLEGHSDRLSKIEVCMGKLEERHDGLNRDMVEVKAFLKEISAEMKAGFKEIAGRAHA